MTIRLNDTSGKGGHGTLTGGATYDASGKFNQACSFNGSTAYISIPDSNDLDMTTGFSILAWVKPTVSTFSYIVNKTNSPTPFHGSYWLATSQDFCGLGGPFGGYTQGGTDVNACYGTALATSPIWTHMAVTYEALGDPNVRLYLDAVQVTQASGSATLSVGTGGLRIGAGLDGFFSGLIDEVWIFKGQLPLNGPDDGSCASVWSAANYIITRIMNCPINTLTPTSPVGIKIGASPAVNRIGGSGVIRQGN